MKIVSRDPGTDPSTPFGEVMEEMRVCMDALHDQRVAELWHVVAAVLNRIGVRRPAEYEEMTALVKEFISPAGAARDRFAETFDAETPRRLRVAAWLLEQGPMAFIDDVAVARRTDAAAVLDLFETAVQGLLLLPRTGVWLRNRSLPVDWFFHVVKKSRDLDPSVLAEFDTKVSRIRHTDWLGYRRAVQRIHHYLSDPEASARRVEGRRGVYTTYTSAGEGIMTVRGPSAAVAALDARLDGLARALIRRQTTALGIPEHVEIIDDRSRQQLRFDFLATSNPAGTVPAITADDAAGLLAAHHATLAEDGDITATAEALAAATENLDIACPTEPGWLSRHAKVIITIPYLNLLNHLVDGTGSPESSASADAAQAGLPGTVNGHPISAQTALDLLADGPEFITRMATDPVTGDLLDQTARTYKVPEKYRLLLAARWLTCTVPQCRRSAHHAEIDHIVPFDHTHPENGGPTTLENLHPVCKYHHQQKTAGLLNAERDPDTGILYWIFPGGTRAPAQPPPDPIEELHAAALAARIAHPAAHAAAPLHDEHIPPPGDEHAPPETEPPPEPVQGAPVLRDPAADGTATDGTAAGGTAASGEPELFSYD